MSETITLDSGEVLDLADFPLPDGLAETPEQLAALYEVQFNREQLAKAMDVSLPTITRWCEDGMPMVSRGGNGQAYEFRFWHCYAWRVWSQAREAADRHKKESLASQVAMHFLGEDADADPRTALTPQQIKAHSEAELVRNRAAEQRGALVRTTSVQRVFDDVMVAFRNGLVNLPDWLEQEFNLSPQQVVAAENYADRVLDEVRRKISEGGFTAQKVVSLADKERGNNG